MVIEGTFVIRVYEIINYVAYFPPSFSVNNVAFFNYKTISAQGKK